MHLTHVDKPIDLRGLTVRNRIVRAAHATGMAKTGVDDKLIAYHEARARGGVGLTIVELLPVHESTTGYMPIYTAPVMADGLRRLVDAVRPHGMRIFQQLWHGGHQAPPSNGAPPWSASDVAAPGNGITPIPMTRGMIDDVVAGFANAARHCEEWGFEGVDIHCAHGYLIHQFLSPNTNRREDAYGGTLENRCRFMLEVLRAVRAAVSPSFVVGIRVAPDVIAGGVSSEDAAEAAWLAEAEGLIDYVNISLGSGYASYAIVGGMDQPMGYELPTSLPIVRKVSVPSIVIGRFRTLEEADQVIRAGEADMVGMVRATLADPDLVTKTLSGGIERVRPCIGCNQGCLGGLYNPAGHMGCVVNPAAGFERSLSEDRLTPAKQSRDVLVVGGGPAGMEAARIAALRGHSVRLIEAQPHLGGALRLAARAPARHGIGDIASWLESELGYAGVKVDCNTYLDADDVAAMSPDAVVVATGSLPRMDGVQLSNPGEPIKGMTLAKVVSSHDVLGNPGRHWEGAAVVVDDVGHYEGIATAEYLLEQGASVTYVTRHISFAPLMETSFTNTPALRRLGRGGFRLMTRTHVLEVSEQGVLTVPTYADSDNNGACLIPADTVVVVSANKPNRSLYDDLVDRGVDTRVIGDANAPRFLGAAIREGRLAGMEV